MEVAGSQLSLGAFGHGIAGQAVAQPSALNCLTASSKSATPIDPGVSTVSGQHRSSTTNVHPIWLQVAQHTRAAGRSWSILARRSLQLAPPELLPEPPPLLEPLEPPEPPPLLDAAPELLPEPPPLLEPLLDAAPELLPEPPPLPDPPPELLPLPPPDPDPPSYPASLSGMVAVAPPHARSTAPRSPNL
jgi:hypothetical protein